MPEYSDLIERLKGGDYEEEKIPDYNMETINTILYHYSEKINKLQNLILVRWKEIDDIIYQLQTSKTYLKNIRGLEFLKYILGRVSDTMFNYIVSLYTIDKKICDFKKKKMKMAKFIFPRVDEHWYMSKNSKN